MDEVNMTSPTECHLIVAFTSIAGFAGEFDNKTDREIFDLLGQLYELTENEVANSGGKIVKFIGDAALIVYPAEKPRSAVAALRHLKATADDWLKVRVFGNQLRIRAHVGPVTCGLLGTRREKRFDVIGRTVNIAALLDGEDFEISPELEALINS